MARSRGAGDLRHRVAFDKRVEIDRGDGVTVGDWVEQYQCRAGFMPLRGGESVMASRLQGQKPMVIFVRSCIQSRAVTPEYRVRDVRTGVTYNIRDVTLSDGGLWVDFLCQGGVADG